MDTHSRMMCMLVAASCWQSKACYLSRAKEPSDCYSSAQRVFLIPTSYGTMSLNRRRAFPRSCSGNKSSLRAKMSPLIKPVSKYCRHRRDLRPTLQLEYDTTDEYTLPHLIYPVLIDGPALCWHQVGREGASMRKGITLS